jgi:hypothetical protein
LSNSVWQRSDPYKAISSIASVTLPKGGHVI